MDAPHLTRSPSTKDAWEMLRQWNEAQDELGRYRWMVTHLNTGRSG